MDEDIIVVVVVVGGGVVVEGGAPPIMVAEFSIIALSTPINAPNRTASIIIDFLAIILTTYFYIYA